MDRHLATVHGVGVLVALFAVPAVLLTTLERVPGFRPGQRAQRACSPGLGS